MRPTPLVSPIIGWAKVGIYSHLVIGMFVYVMNDGFEAFKNYWVLAVAIKLIGKFDGH